MRWTYLLTVFLHLGAVLAWLGGMLFLALVVVPVIRREPDDGMAAELISVLGGRFRALGWICLALLPTTGILLLGLRGYSWSNLVDGSLWEGSFGQTLAYKLMIFAAILILSGVHDFYVGPRAAEVWRREPASLESQRLRKAASWFGRINLLLGLAALFLGISLVRGGI